jgi:hypothetical protein
LDGRINLLTGVPGHFHLKLEESDPSNHLASLVPGFAEVKGGKIRGECNFDPGIGMRGFVEYERGNFSLKKAPLNFEGVNLRGVFKEDGILFSGNVDQFNGSRLAVDGFIENLLKPQMDVRVRCPRFDVAGFTGSLHPALRNIFSRKGQFQIRITGSPKNPSVLGSVSADGLKGLGFSFDTFVSDVTLQDSVLMVNGSGQSVDGLNCRAETVMRMVRSGTWMKIQASLTGDARTLLPSILRSRLRTVFCDAGLKLEGPSGAIHGEASAKFSMTPLKGRSFDVFSNYFYSSGKCLLLRPVRPGIPMNGEINDPLGKDRDGAFIRTAFRVWVPPFFRNSGMAGRTVSKSARSHPGTGPVGRSISAPLTCGEAVSRRFSVSRSKIGERTNSAGRWIWRGVILALKETNFP